MIIMIIIMIVYMVEYLHRSCMIELSPLQTVPRHRAGSLRTFEASMTTT